MKLNFKTYMDNSESVFGNYILSSLNNEEIEKLKKTDISLLEVELILNGVQIQNPVKFIEEFLYKLENKTEIFNSREKLKERQENLNSLLENLNKLSTEISLELSEIDNIITEVNKVGKKL